MPGDPKECRDRALYCAKRATACISPLARDQFFYMASPIRIQPSK